MSVTKRKLLIFIVLTTAVAAIALAVVSANVRSAFGEEGVWTGYSVGAESGSSVYSANSNDLWSVQTLEYSSSTGENDQISFSMRANGSWNGDVEAHLTFYVDAGEDFIGFKIMNYWKAIRIVRFDKNGNETFIKDAVNYADNGGGKWSNTYKWYNFRLVFNSTAFEVYVDDVRISTGINLDKFDVSDTTCRFSSWGCAPSIKDIIFSKRNGAEETFGDYSAADEKGDTVYTANGDVWDVKNLYYSGTTKNSDMIKFSFRPNTDWNGDDTAHVTAYIALAPEKYLGFRFMNYWNASRIIIMDGNAASNVTEAKYVLTSSYVEGWLDTDKWFDVRIYFSERYIVVIVDGYVCNVIHHLHGYELKDRPVFIGNWGHNVSIKDFSTSSSGVNPFELGYMDLEFTDEASLTALTVSGGSVGYSDGCAVFDIFEDGATLTVNDNQRDLGPYCADMSVRNSVMTRLKNSSSADSVTVTVRTDASTTAYSKTVALKGNDDFNTYLINFSSFAPRGYITQVAFTLNGASSGSVAVDFISFEREEAFYDYAGAITSCVADKSSGMVTVTGKVKSAHTGKTVTVYVTPMSNYAENVIDAGLEIITTAHVASDGSFAASFPLEDGRGISRLGQSFIATTGYTKISSPFRITNYRDFVVNPYEFTLPDLAVKITSSPYNAVGDGYTDDTAAIQTAIDFVSSSGGGTVIIPGDTTVEGGKRYIATALRIKDNVELRIETGATIWQSPRAEDYKYKVLFGHDYVSDSMWPHACNVNEPLILMKDATNVRITGGGTVRLADWGMNELDSVAVTDPNRGKNCANIIHIAPIYINNCKNVEVSDITILHTNNWHITTTYCENMAIMNVTEKDASCANSDGLGLASAHNVYVARNYLYSNDDAITLIDTPEDPRRSFWWNESDSTADRTIKNIQIEYNNMWGGLGLVFIAWGSASSDLEKVSIRNLVVHDNYISGHQAIGSWPDNPFYGTSAFSTYNFNEQNDFSPVFDIYMYNNDYPGNYCDLSWARVPSVRVYATNFITNYPYKCADSFVNASFERDFRFKEEKDFTSGLTNWTFTYLGGAASTVKRGEKTVTTSVDDCKLIVADYAALVHGGALWQGLYLETGVYTFSANCVGAEGGYIFFGKPEARTNVTDDFGVTVLKKRDVSSLFGYASAKITFEVKTAGVYALGFIAEGELIFDDCEIRENAVVNEALQEVYRALKDSETIDLGLFTAQSVAAFNEATALLASVAAAQSISESECKNAVNAYNSAVKALEVKTDELDNSSSQSADISSSEEGSASVYDPESADISPLSPYSSQKQSSKPSQETKSGGCGGNVTAGALITVLLTALAAVIFTRRRRII